MLTLRVTEDCKRCRSLAGEMAQNHLAHKVLRVAPEDRSAHSLLDGSEKIQGHDAIEARIQSLLGQRRQWQRYPSDVCFDYGREDES